MAVLVIAPTFRNPTVLSDAILKQVLVGIVPAGASEVTVERIRVGGCSPTAVCVFAGNQAPRVEKVNVVALGRERTLIVFVLPEDPLPDAKKTAKRLLDGIRDARDASSRLAATKQFLGWFGDSVMTYSEYADRLADLANHDRATLELVEILHIRTSEYGAKLARVRNDLEELKEELLDVPNLGDAPVAQRLLDQALDEEDRTDTLGDRLRTLQTSLEPLEQMLAHVLEVVAALHEVQRERANKTMQYIGGLLGIVLTLTALTAVNQFLSHEDLGSAATTAVIIVGVLALSPLAIIAGGLLWFIFRTDQPPRKLEDLPASSSPRMRRLRSLMPWPTKSERWWRGLDRKVTGFLEPLHHITGPVLGEAFDSNRRLLTDEGELNTANIEHLATIETAAAGRLRILLDELRVEKTEATVRRDAGIADTVFGPSGEAAMAAAVERLGLTLRLDESAYRLVVDLPDEHVMPRVLLQLWLAGSALNLTQPVAFSLAEMRHHLRSFLGGRMGLSEFEVDAVVESSVKRAEELVRKAGVPVPSSSFFERILACGDEDDPADSADQAEVAAASRIDTALRNLAPADVFAAFSEFGLGRLLRQPTAEPAESAPKA